MGRSNECERSTLLVCALTLMLVVFDAIQRISAVNCPATLVIEVKPLDKLIEPADEENGLDFSVHDLSACFNCIREVKSAECVGRQDFYPEIGGWTVTFPAKGDDKPKSYKYNLQECPGYGGNNFWVKTVERNSMYEAYYLPKKRCRTLILLGQCSTTSRMSCRRAKPSPDVWQRNEIRYFSNTWAVRILRGVSEAKRVAKSVGQQFYMKVSKDLPNVYLFRNPKQPARMNYSSESVTQYMRTNVKILWAEQQAGEVRMTRRHLKGKKRSLNEVEMAADLCPDALNFNDPLWPKQYYIKDCHKTDPAKVSNDLNLAAVWLKHRLFGRNIRVLVVDDGIETKHADLADNYDPTLGLDLQDNDASPDPVHTVRKKYSHGTHCAGIIGMRGNNTICGVGIAPLVTLGAVRLLGPKLSSDYKTCSALLFGLSKVHVVANAWGPNDDGKSMPELGPLTATAFKLGTSKGRQGLGFIHVFAAGNGRTEGDHCGCDALVSSIYTIVAASCTREGKLTTFSERCAGIMVTTYSGTKGHKHNNVVAPDIGGNKCTTDMAGTSASMAMVSGALALALEANPKLSWRDAQHLLAWTSQVAPLQHNPPGTWAMNAAGFYVSHDFGFGMLNINYLVERAKHFRNVGAMHSCTTRIIIDEASRIFRERIAVEAFVNGCEDSPSEVEYLEHVQLEVSVEFPKRGDLQIRLVSPSGTEATLLDRRPPDTNALGLQSWIFDSVMTWGESPRGKWTVYIIGEKRNSIRPQPRSSLRRFWRPFSKKKKVEGEGCPGAGNANMSDGAVHTGELTHLSLTFHGTGKGQEPAHYKDGPRTYDNFKLPQ